MYKQLFFLLLLMPIAFANYPIEDLDPFSEECRAEFDMFMGQQPGELVNEYCSVVNIRILLLVVIIFLMVLFEPKVTKKLKDWDYDNGFIDSDTLINVYRRLLLGMIFMVCYILFLMR